MGRATHFGWVNARRVIPASTSISRADWLQLHALTCVHLQRQMKLSSHTPRQVSLCPVVQISRLSSSQKLQLRRSPQSNSSELTRRLLFEFAVWAAIYCCFRSVTV